MENHPIPQDVTGFKFKLIGDMTVKQFAYLAVGAIFAFVFFYAPLTPFIKFPLGIFFGLIGIGLAFLPVEGRPADAMAGYFLKALVTPNQYAYHKLGGTIALFSMSSAARLSPSMTKQLTTKPGDAMKARQLQQYLQSLQGHPHSPVDKKEEVFLQEILTPGQHPAPQQPTVPTNVLQPAPQASPSHQPKKADAPLDPKDIQEQEANIALQAASVKYELNEAKEHETEEKDVSKATSAHEQVMLLEAKLQILLREKESLEKQLQALKSEATIMTAAVAPPSPIENAQPSPTIDAHLADQVKQELSPEPTAPSPVIPIQKPAAPLPTASPTVRRIPADMAKSIGLPHMPDVPNLIVGIVKDPRGNVLQNILVEVKGKDGTPARAFRTNSLGQFASATPLANGTYTMEFEDPKSQQKFDVVGLEAKGEIMLPLEITSHDEREDLRKELFS